MRTIQFPCNVFELGMAQRLEAGGDIVVIANHPFGGGGRIAESKALLRALTQDRSVPGALREKLGVVDDEVLADVVLNMITRDTGIQVVVPSMLRVEHVRANVAAMERSRFSAEELRWLREAIGKDRPPQGSEATL
jgi:aryl-alcohol dehydrogenase-like predicted oxidoreductase